METALFIPLKREFYEDFRDGVKTEEFRPNGPRWNARTCPTGRPVVLSMGYGKTHRLSGVVTGIRIIADATEIPGWVTCYPHIKGAEAIAIRIQLNPIL